MNPSATALAYFITQCGPLLAAGVLFWIACVAIRLLLRSRSSSTRRFMRQQVLWSDWTMNQLGNWVSEVNQTVEQQRKLAAQANEFAAKLREQKKYDAAEILDRRAEALLCAALVAETRGLSI